MVEGEPEEEGRVWMMKTSLLHEPLSKNKTLKKKYILKVNTNLKIVFKLKKI